jgi:hypothetical protein
MTSSGPVLAYPRTAPARPVERAAPAAIDALLAAHGLALAPSPQGPYRAPALRLVDRQTGEPPARLPEAIAGELAAQVAGLSASAVA